MDEMPGALAQGLAAVGGGLGVLLVCYSGLHMSGGQAALTAIAAAVALIGVTSLMRGEKPPQG